uniref:Uncharacterized protein n=1 Tax=Populus trichocarpa TaxID=3694 RepID=A0A2K1X274_POPTR
MHIVIMRMRHDSTQPPQLSNTSLFQGHYQNTYDACRRLREREREELQSIGKRLAAWDHIYTESVHRSPSGQHYLVLFFENLRTMFRIWFKLFRH